MPLAALAAVAFIGLMAAPAAAADFPAKDSLYHSYTEMVADIHAVETAHPDIVHVFSIGKSYQGRDIWAAKISDNVGTDEAEPEVLFDALHHAREHLTVEQALYLLHLLADDYGQGHPDHEHRQHPRGLDHLRGQPGRLRVRPDLHGQQPRRRTARGARTASPTRGSSAIGTDLNRNYDYDWGCCGGSSGTQVVDHVSRPEGVLGARDAGGRATSSTEPRRRRDPADQGPHHLPHERPADPVAVRPHEDRHPAGHVGRRPPRVRRDRQGDGRPERLQGRAVERPLHHRRGPDRLAVRPPADLLVHDRALSAGDADGLGRPLPARREDRAARRPTTASALLYFLEHGGLPVRGDRQDGPELRPVLRRHGDPARLGREPGRQRHGPLDQPVRPRQPVADERVRPADAAGRHLVGPLRVRDRRAGRLAAPTRTTSTARPRSGASPIALPATPGSLSFSLLLVPRPEQRGRFLPALRRGRGRDQASGLARRSGPPSPSARRGTRPGSASPTRAGRRSA